MYPNICYEERTYKRTDRRGEKGRGSNYSLLSRDVTPSFLSVVYTNKVLFEDHTMKVEHLDERKPFYNSINLVPGGMGFIL